MPVCERVFSKFHLSSRTTSAHTEKLGELFDEGDSEEIEPGKAVR